MDELYFASGYIDNNFFVYTANAGSVMELDGSNLSSSSTIAADGVYITPGYFVDNYYTIISDNIVNYEITSSIQIEPTIFRNTECIMNVETISTIINTRLKYGSTELVISSEFKNPYSSFKNKRPHTAQILNPGVIYGFHTGNKKFGTASFYTLNGYGNLTNGFNIPTTGQQNISDGQDFYISAWIKSSPTAAGHTTGDFIPLVEAGAWSFGYVVDSYLSAAFRFYTYSGTQIIVKTTFNGTNGVSLTANTSFCHYEAFRSNGVLTFRFDNNSGQSYGSPNITNITNNGPLYLSYNRVGFEANGVISGYSYLDEFFFAKGISSVKSYYPDGSIADGNLSTTQWLFKFDSNLNDTITGIFKENVALSSNFNLNLTFKNEINASANLVNNTSLISSINYITHINSNLNISSSIFANNLRLKNFIVNASNNSELIVNPITVITISSELNSNYNLLSTINRTRNLSANLLMNSGEMAINTRLVQFNINLTSSFNSTISVNTNVLNIINLNSEFITNINAKRTVGINKDLLNVSDIIINNRRIRSSSINTNVMASQMTIAVTKVNEIATLTSRFDMNITSTVIPKFGVIIVMNFDSIITPTRTRNINIELINETYQSCLVDRVIDINCNIEVNSNLYTNFKLFNLDPDLTYFIPYENRYYSISKEDRSNIISYEERSFII